MVGIGVGQKFRRTYSDRLSTTGSRIEHTVERIIEKKIREIRFAISTPLLVVAAVDSRNKEGADFHCDGVRDEFQINKAIREAGKGGGGEIILLEGNYSISETIKIEKHNITLSGEGNLTIIKLADNADTIMIQIGKLPSTNAANNFIIKDMVLDGNKGNQSGTNDILTLNEDEVLIERCTIKNSINDGISGAVDVDFVTINNCIINNNTKSGILIKGQLWKINNNWIKNNSDHGISVVGTAGTVQTGLINGNHIISNGDEGIRLEATTGGCDFFIVTNNIILGNDVGILLVDGGCNYTTIMQNVVVTNSSAQITDNGTKTIPNGARGTNSLALDDHNQIAL